MHQTQSTSASTHFLRHDPTDHATAICDELVGPPRPEPDQPSTHRTLLPLLQAAERGTRDALAPGPTVNRSLGRLVELVTTAGLRPQTLRPTPERLPAVARAVDHRLATSPSLAERAADLRRIAGLAETELELHHARLLLAGEQAEPTDRSSAPGTPNGTDRPNLGPTDPLAAALGGFPYLANYRLLTDAELAGLATLTETRHLTFCGAGALPLTGVLANGRTGARVRLIDIDPPTVELACRVVHHLEQRRQVARGRVRVELGDAGAIDLSGTDAVVIASLIPTDTVMRLTERLGMLPVGRRPVLIVRSATGLVRHFAYDRIEPSTIEAVGGYRHAGSVVPDGWQSRSGGRPLAVADRSVLNTSEYFLPTGTAC
ncbi:MAG: nicotianamine synthase family protein [Actinomycetota bacterium]